MNSKIFSRIEHLYSRLGIDVGDGSEGRAEAAALAAGFDFAEAFFDHILSNIFIQTADGEGLKMFLSLINEKRTGDDESGRQLVIDRLSKGWGYLKYDDFVEELKKISPSAEFIINGNNITLINIANPVSAESLINAGRFIKEYVPVFSTVRLSGNGITFNFFDSLDMPWFQLDEVNLPFCLLDKLD